MRITKKQRVLEYLKEHKSITQREATEYCGTTRLAAHIYVLKDEGHKIITTTVEGVDKFGGKTRYAKYVLVA